MKKGKLRMLFANIMALITCSMMSITAFADGTSPEQGNPSADALGGIPFLNWIKSVITEYAWVLAFIALVPLAITYFLGGQEAGEKGKHKAFNICLGVFILCVGNMFIQAARSAFEA